MPSLCGITGNEKADKLLKAANLLEQPENQIDYSEAKAILKTHLKNRWNNSHDTEKGDNLPNLNRCDQVTIFRLRTGHCQLTSHLYKLKLCVTNECPCGTSI